MKPNPSPATGPAPAAEREAEIRAEIRAENLRALHAATWYRPSLLERRLGPLKIR